MMKSNTKEETDEKEEANENEKRRRRRRLRCPPAAQQLSVIFYRVFSFYRVFITGFFSSFREVFLRPLSRRQDCT